MKIIEEGTRGVALAPERGKVPVVFEYRDSAQRSSASAHRRASRYSRRSSLPSNRA
jgi:hypothetical protein